MTVQTAPATPAVRKTAVARMLELIGDLEDRRRRRWIYLACAVLLYVMALGMMTSKALFSKAEPQFDFATSDGKFYYQYLPSVILDRDLDFTNQLREGWGYEPPYDAVLEHDRVKYPIGVSLSLMPSFLVAHCVSLPLYAITGKTFFQPNGYSIVYQLLNLAAVMGFSFATLLLVDGLLTRTFNLHGAHAAAAILATFMGTAYLYHTVRFPGFAHVVSTFWVTAMVCCAINIVRQMRDARPPGWTAPAMAFCFAMAVVCRSTNVVYATLFVPVGYIAIREKWIGRVIVWLPIALLACWPIVLQLLCWKQMFGVYFPDTYSHGEYFEPFYWTRPQLFNNLLSLKAGVLLWNPVWLLALIGLVMNAKKFGPMTWLLACSAVSAGAIWYINSAWWCWPLSAYPGRGFLELSGIAALGIGLLIQQATVQRRVVLLTLVAGACITAGLAVAYDLRLVPRYVDDLYEWAETGLRKT